MTSNSTKSESFFIKYLLSCASAAVAETVTYPLDITKTLLQLQNEMMLKNFVQTKKLGMIKTGLNIVKNEGALSLWAGITPAVLRHCAYSGSRMVIYEKLRNVVRTRTKLGEKSHLGYKPVFFKTNTSILINGNFFQNLIKNE